MYSATLVFALSPHKPVINTLCVVGVHAGQVSMEISQLIHTQFKFNTVIIGDQKKMRIQNL